jgi:hypothetical protein
MKRFLTVSLAILVLILSCFVISCGSNDEIQGEQMLYTADTSLGEGNTVFTLVVVHIDGTTVNFQISTDKTILSDALTEVGILEGHDDIYGMYIDKVNGITQSWDVDNSYWAIYEGDAYASSGIDGISIVNGATYKLIATK